MVKKEDVRKEFDDFARKVAQLESLRQELEGLNTKGFEVEVRIIKSKLKNVNLIPEIRKEIDELHHKISSKKTNGFEKSILNNKLLKDSKELKEETEYLKDKISSLEKTLDNKRKISKARQLTKKQEDYISDIPKLESELRGLKKQFEEHTKSAKMKIDSGVGVLVDTKFDDFVGELKAELTERLQQKELTLDAQLKSDLVSREKLFAQHYSELVKEFQDKYKRKVEDELKKDVHKRFNVELDNALASERRKIVDALVKEHAKRLHADRARLVKELQADYENKEKLFEQKLQRELAEKRNLINKKNEIANQRLREIEVRENRAHREHESADKIRMDFADKMKSLEEEKAKHEREFRDSLSELKKHEILMRKNFEESRERQLERQFNSKLKNKIAQIESQKNSLIREREQLDRAIEQKQKAKERVDRRKKALNEAIKKLEKERDYQKKRTAVEISDFRKRENEKFRKQLLSARRKQEAQLRKKFDYAVRVKLSELARQKDKLVKQQRAVAQLLGIKTKVSQEKRYLEETQRKQRQQLEQEERRFRDEAHKKLTAHIALNDMEFNKRVELMKNQMHKDLAKALDSQRKKNNAVLNNELNRREKELRHSLDKEYEEKFRRELFKKEQELEKKKAEFESHIIEQTKKLFH